MLGSQGITTVHGYAMIPAFSQYFFAMVASPGPQTLKTWGRFLKEFGRFLKLWMEIQMLCILKLVYQKKEKDSSFGMLKA